MIRQVAPDLNIGLELADEWHVDFIDDVTQRWYSSRQYGIAPAVGDVDRAVATTERGVSKLYVVAPEQVRQGIVQVLADKGLRRRLSLTSSGEDMLEIMAAGVNKGAALHAVATLLGIPPAQVMALGDGLNDIPLLRQAGLGIAMANAPEPVRLAARIVAGPNTADGWASAVEKYVLAAV